MVPYKEGWFTLTLDSGITLKARTSSTALTLLNLNVGDEVNILFNPSSLKLY
ncbi:hypothetical protein [Oceanispirochaeta crateris]|uniref:hypothetical protein n=1 Tax=Oceanispirochaeta crateris TaxID=2518645 RepID=UPI00143DAA45|nr:hypothetical protein [Oceanispirochaeta crateris]